MQGVSITSDGDVWEAKVHGITKDGKFTRPPSEFRVDTSYIKHEKNGVPGSVVVYQEETEGKMQVFYLTAVAARLLTVRLYLFLEEIPGFSLIYDTNSEMQCESQGFRLWEIDYPQTIKPNPKYQQHDFSNTEKSLKDSWERGESILH